MAQPSRGLAIAVCISISLHHIIEPEERAGAGLPAEHARLNDVHFVNRNTSVEASGVQEHCTLTRLQRRCNVLHAMDLLEPLAMRKSSAFFLVVAALLTACVHDPETRTCTNPDDCALQRDLCHNSCANRDALSNCGDCCQSMFKRCTDCQSWNAKDCYGN
jgi:hypothetical protein